MSKSRKVTINCRKCNKQFDITIYDSINVDIDPELREEFLYQRIFFHKCPHCGDIMFLPMPVLYHDMTHNFMVQGGTLIDLDVFHNALSKRGMFDENDNSINKIHGVGATSITQSIEKVVALENGLDHRIATIYRVIEALQYKKYAKEHNVPELFDSYLCYDDDKDIAVILDLDTDENPKTICKKVDMDFYKKVEDTFKDLIVGTNEFLFNYDLALKVINIAGKDMEFYKSIKPEIAIFEPTKGDPFFVKVPIFNSGKFATDDLVICCDNDCILKAGRVHKIIDTMSVYEMPCDYKNIPYILRKKNLEGYETSANSDAAIDNKKLLEALVKFDDVRKDFPYDLGKGSNAILGMTAYITNRGMKQVFLEEEFKGRKLLCVYLSQSDVPNEYNNKIVSKMVFRFEDIVSLVIEQPDKYSGIIINPNKENIILALSHLVDLYLPDRILTDDSRTIDLLQKLTDKEIEFVGEDNYKYIAMVYFENKNPIQIAKELNLKSNVIGEAISEGYQKLKTIIRCNY